MARMKGEDLRKEIMKELKDVPGTVRRYVEDRTMALEEAWPSWGWWVVIFVAVVSFALGSGVGAWWAS